MGGGGEGNPNPTEKCLFGEYYIIIFKRKITIIKSLLCKYSLEAGDFFLYINLFNPNILKFKNKNSYNSYFLLGRRAP